MLVLKGRIIDGNGGEPIEQGVVVVERNKITLVCRENEYNIPENARVIEVEDGTIMPGFIEGHVHLALGDDYYRIYREHVYHAVCRAIKDMKTLLNGGFTTIRECGGLSNYLKAPLAEGLIEGPRIFSAGKCILQTGGHLDFIKEYPVEFTEHPWRNFASQIADGVDEVRRTARLAFREGADFLKVMGTAGVACQGDKLFTREYSMEELRAFVEEAENYGTYVAIHAHANIGIKAALKAGVKSIEHASFLEEDDMEIMVKNGAWIIPTITTGWLSMQKLDQRAPWVGPKLIAASARSTESYRMAYKAGVTIGFGADLGGGPITPFDQANMEFPLMVERIGMTPMEVIMAATKTGSKIILREDELGTLEAGKLADIVVAKGNPLEDIALLGSQDNIKVVVKDGKVCKEIH